MTPDSARICSPASRCTRATAKLGLWRTSTFMARPLLRLPWESEANGGGPPGLAPGAGSASGEREAAPVERVGHRVGELGLARLGGVHGVTQQRRLPVVGLEVVGDDV